MNGWTLRHRVGLAVVAVLLALLAAGVVTGGTPGDSHEVGQPLPAVDDLTPNGTTDDGNVTAGTANTTTDTTTDATNATDDIANATIDATNVTGDATDATGDASDDATNGTEGVAGTADGTTGDATNATDDITDGVVEATDATVGDLDTTSDVTNATSDVVDATAGTGVGVTGVTGSSTTDPTDGGTGTSDGPAIGNEEAGDGEATDGEATDEEATAPGSGTAGDGNRAGGPSVPSTPDDPAGVSDLGVGLASVVAGLAPVVAGVGTAALDLAAAYGSAASVHPDGVSSTRLRRSGVFDRFRRFWAAAFRYSRHDDSDPLGNDGRRAVYEEIEASPAIYLSAVAEHADVPLSTTRHHVRVLEDERLVTSAKIRGKRRYFPAGTDGTDPEVHAALSEPATARVLEALADLDRAHVGQLADELGRDPSTVSHHLDRLAADGLVERERDGRAVINRLSPATERALHDGAMSRDSAPAATDERPA